MSSPDKLVYMANQIGRFFATQGKDVEIDGIATHIKKYWEPRMLKQIYAHLDAGGVGLEPAVKVALTRLKEADSATA
ncbi:MAG: formate dehydrogenase subunit delta [Pseudolabrys sp.]